MQPFSYRGPLSGLTTSPQAQTANKPVLPTAAPRLTPPVRRQLKFRADAAAADEAERTAYLRTKLPGEPLYPGPSPLQQYAANETSHLPT